MRGKDVVFIAPAVLSPKEVIINKFLPKHPFDFQIVPIDLDDYNVYNLPTFVIIDKNSKVVENSFRLFIAEIEQKINELLKQ